MPSAYHVTLAKVQSAKMIFDARRNVPNVKTIVHKLFLVFTSGMDFESVKSTNAYNIH